MLLTLSCLRVNNIAKSRKRDSLVEKGFIQPGGLNERTKRKEGKEKKYDLDLKAIFSRLFQKFNPLKINSSSNNLYKNLRKNKHG